MHRVSYRYVPAKTYPHRVVGAFTSHANGVDAARVRWFELAWRPPTLNAAPHWVLEQEGVVPFADGVHRWMPSIAMDAQGTIVLGYDASDSTSLFPSMMATSRSANDPAGQVRREVLVQGAEPNTNITSNRWGDYQSMSVWQDVYVFSGQVGAETEWTHHTRVLKLLGESFVRTFTASDACTVQQCEQIITTL